MDDLYISKELYENKSFCLNNKDLCNDVYWLKKLEEHNLAYDYPKIKSMIMNYDIKSYFYEKLSKREFTYMIFNYQSPDICLKYALDSINRDVIEYTLDKLYNEGYISIIEHGLMYALEMEYIGIISLFDKYNLDKDIYINGAFRSGNESLIDKYHSYNDGYSNYAYNIGYGGNINLLKFVDESKHNKVYMGAIDGCKYNIINMLHSNFKMYLPARDLKPEDMRYFDLLINNNYDKYDILKMLLLKPYNIDITDSVISKLGIPKEEILSLRKSELYMCMSTIFLTGSVNNDSIFVPISSEQNPSYIIENFDLYVTGYNIYEKFRYLLLNYWNHIKEFLPNLIKYFEENDNELNRSMIKLYYQFKSNN